MRVYFDEGSNGFCATFCDLGVVMAQGWDTVDEKCCSSMACVCASEGRLRLASPEETKAFWDSMASMADAAAAESRW